MATRYEHEPLDIEEQRTRINKALTEIEEARAHTQKMLQDIKLATPQMFFQGGIAMAALIGAVVALVKLFP